MESRCASLTSAASSGRGNWTGFSPSSILRALVLVATFPITLDLFHGYYSHGRLDEECEASEQYRGRAPQGCFQGDTSTNGDAYTIRVFLPSARHAAIPGQDLEEGLTAGSPCASTLGRPRDSDVPRAAGGRAHIARVASAPAPTCTTPCQPPRRRPTTYICNMT